MKRIAALACIVAAAMGVADEPYHWPLDLPRQLTSSFAEYRSGRFHAGIDLRTGPIGKPVYAAGNGYIERIRSSPYGYGNAIYLRLDDGNSIVYGHLDSFEEPMASYVRKAQHARESFTVDLYPDKALFPIQRGQLIARSGNTGIGYPHLHYEFRDPAGNPINPRILGLDWPDKVRPTPRKILLVPRGPGAFLNGDIEPVVLELRNDGAGKYATNSVRAWGSIAVGVDVIDPADGSKLGVWRIKTAIDGQEVFRTQHDLFTYDNTHNAAVSYHPFLEDRGRFLVQWRWPGNQCNIYAHSPSDGWIAVPEGNHEITLRIMDFNDNEAFVTIPIVGERPEWKTPTAANTQTGSIDIDCWGEWLAVTAEFPAAEAEAPVLQLNGMIEADAFYPVSGKRWRAAVQAAPGTEHLVIEVTHPRLVPFRKEFIVALRGEKARAFRAADLEIHTAPTSPYGTLYLSVDTADVAKRVPTAPLGQAYAIGLPRSPIDEPVRIQFQVPLDGVQPERVDIYRVGGNSASPVGATRSGNTFTFTTRGLGTFVALEDSTPPAISDFVTSPGSKPTRPKIEAAVADRLSGIDDIRLTFNGQWLLLRYDPEHDRIVWEQDHDLPSGPGELTLTVVDNAGNRETRTIAITIP